MRFQFLSHVWFCTVQMEMDDIVIDVNDKHMTSWGDACRRDAIHNTPLNPYLDRVGTAFHNHATCNFPR